jgi:sulfate/thiosulfate transport system ATP-binding protein
MSISVRNLSKTFGSFAALRSVDLRVETGELVALLGPSGSGKTTLLRIIAGLERPDPGGSILFQDEDVVARPVGERQVGFVFQHYALFRHMSVFENVAFGLRVRPKRERLPTEEIARRVRDLLKLVQLEAFADRYPNQLSGGQRQRIALARALAVEPRVLLLDEPFGALDAMVRVELRRWLRRLHDEIHVTSVFVTHDQEEALEVADRVVVMDHGRIEQIGTPDEVYDEPASPFVYQFLGTANRFQGRVEDGRAVVGGQEFLGAEGLVAGDAVGYVRPHEIEVVRISNGRPSLAATVLSAHSAGPMARVQLAREDTGDVVEVVLTRRQFDQLLLRAGEHVHLIPQRMRVFSGAAAESRPQSSAGTSPKRRSVSGDSRRWIG